MFEEYIIESDGFVTFYLINNRVTYKPELVAHFTSFKDVGEIKEFVKQFETEASITRPATIH